MRKEGEIKVKKKMVKDEEGREAEMEERGIRTGRGGKEEGRERREESLQELLPGHHIFYRL